MAAATNYRRFSGLQQEQCIPSQFWKPEVQNQFYWSLSPKPFISYWTVEVLKKLSPAVAAPAQSLPLE